MIRHPTLNPHPWFESRHAITFQFSRGDQKDVIGVEMFSLVVTAECEVYASVHQQDERCIGAPGYIDVGELAWAALHYQWWWWRLW